MYIGEKASINEIITHHELLSANLFRKKNLVQLWKLLLLDHVYFYNKSTLIPNELEFMIMSQECRIPPVVYAHFLRLLCHYHLGYFILIIIKFDMSPILHSKKSYVTLNEVELEFTRLNVNVDLKQANPGESIRYVFGNGLVLDYQVDYSFETKLISWEYKIENSFTGKTALNEKYDRLFDGCSLFSYLILHTLIAFVDVLPAESYDINYEKYKATQTVKLSDLLSEVRNWQTRQIFEIILFAMSTFAILKLCLYYTCQYETNWLSSLCNVWRKGGGKVNLYDNCLGNIVNENDLNNYIYDVIIISTENDHDFIIDNAIITCLESKGYKVCVPDRDFDAGISRFLLFSNAIQISKTIVVVCSEEFLKDSFLNKIVFGDFIMSMSEDGKINGKNIFLIIKDVGIISTC
ncbi:unnamed protein product [Mytilus coruscus]|uniref:TIR domain-containing protein n=1 Tax=Mytilus coruscus TaxID=42192 RepID=A0A6J8BUA2_MYTCO|nr:unnamed protein product [Mytilus coruscus]